MEDQFVMLPITVLFDERLKMNDKVVYSALRSYRNESKGGVVYPSRATIAKKLNCSTDTIDRSIKRLVKYEHLSYTKGSKGRANTYRFLDKNSRKGAAIQASSSRQHDRLDAATDIAVVRPQPEPENQNHKSKNVLYHGNDSCFVQPDGAIKIKTHNNQYVDYGGGDDERFHFGNLHGYEARKAALTYYADK